MGSSVQDRSSVCAAAPRWLRGSQKNISIIPTNVACLRIESPPFPNVWLSCLLRQRVSLILPGRSIPPKSRRGQTILTGQLIEPTGGWGHKSLVEGSRNGLESPAHGGTLSAR